MRADLMVRTGDHWDDSVSRQMAPCRVSVEQSSSIMSTHCLRADIGVPHLGLEAHDRWPERVLARDLDVDMEGAALVRRVWRP
jgi:hypothetical protein